MVLQGGHDLPPGGAPASPAPDDDPEFLRNLEQDIRRKRHHRDEDGNGGSPEDAGPGEAG